MGSILFVLIKRNVKLLQKPVVILSGVSYNSMGCEYCTELQWTLPNRATLGTVKSGSNNQLALLSEVIYIVFAYPYH